MKRASVFIFVLFMMLCTACATSKADRALSKCGITEKKATVGSVTFNYAEGPANGSALLLLHAQLLDWYTYHKVLPELSRSFHVFALDYQGHGKTAIPTDYEMSANHIGSDIASFMEQVIGEAAYVTGNSSGGLLATWLCANRPDLVLGAVLEDPPLFSSEYPEIQNTVANRAFRASYNALHDEQFDGDYLMYWVQNSDQFFKTYTKPGTQKLLKKMIIGHRKKHPGEPMDFPVLPDSVQEMIRGLDRYNPAFGAAFYEGTWNSGFDHADALAKIQCKVVLIHADFSYLDDGTLNGAMSQEMADRAVSLIPRCTYKRIHAGHVTNIEAPEEFIRVITEAFCE